MRLTKQLLAGSTGKKPGNHVDPLVLKGAVRYQLRAALKGGETLLHILKNRYQLDMMAR